jgi:hypothetical protein
VKERPRSVPSLTPPYSQANPSPSPSRLLGSPGGVGIGPSTWSQSMSPPEGTEAGADAPWLRLLLTPPPLAPPPSFGAALAEVEADALGWGLELAELSPNDEVSHAMPSPSASRPFGSLGSSTRASWASARLS